MKKDEFNKAISDLSKNKEIFYQASIKYFVMCFA